jgi:hypothetical protein
MAIFVGLSGIVPDTEQGSNDAICGYHRIGDLYVNPEGPGVPGQIQDWAPDTWVGWRDHEVTTDIFLVHRWSLAHILPLNT